MARGDFFVRDGRGAVTPVAYPYRVKLGTSASINAGEWVIVGSDATGVILAANGADNTKVWVGVAASDSNETTTVDGTVYVFDSPTYMFRGRAVTAASLTNAVLNTKVTLNVAAGTNGAQKINQSTTVNGTLRILAIDSTNNTVDVQMRDFLLTN